jgi:hypothetical protein
MRRGGDRRSRKRPRLPILTVVLLLAGFALPQATAVAEAADRSSRAKPATLWTAFPLEKRRGQKRPRAAPQPPAQAFEPPRPASAVSAPDTGGRFYLTPFLLALALVFLSTVVWRDVRARRAAVAPRGRVGTSARSGPTGIRYRD